MKKLLILSILLLTFTTLRSQVPKGERILSWHVDMSENGSYDSAMSYARRACLESLPLFFTWRSLEDSAGVFNSSFMNQTLRIANFYYPLFGIPVELQLAPINTVRREVPADLQNLPFDDPRMISRFKTLLDTVFSRLPDLTLTSLSIGNESDGYLGSDLQAYLEYKSFLDSVIPYARKLYSALHGEDLLIGTTFMFNGLVSPAKKSLCKLVNTGRDFIAVTYYPLNPDFTMKPPSVVFDDFDKITGEYPDTARPIHFVECGYASSAVCNSSEALQAEFYRNVFSAWDQHADRIRLIAIVKLSDWSQAVVDQLAGYYGLPNLESFKEYLRTLGVRTYPGDGKNKAAYEAILCELAARNWCTVSCKATGVEDLQKAKGGLYPNPVQRHFTLSAKGQIMSVSVYNSAGRLLIRKTGNKRSIDVSSLPAGFYVARVHYRDGSEERYPFVKGQ